LAYLSDKLRKIQDGDGTLLDHTMIVYGSSMSNSNQHDHDPLPVVLVGGGSGQIKGGRHIVAAPHTPMPNLMLGMLDKLGVHQESFGDSTGGWSGVSCMGILAASSVLCYAFDAGHWKHRTNPSGSVTYNCFMP
jgi:hypothetical protein